MSDVRAIVAADIHLQIRPPLARADEPDWFAAMARPLAALRDLQEQYDGVPIFYAGDIFDRWNSPPELVNFALEHLPRGYAVPGQHDLPNHAYADIGRSAYWTLVKAGHITNLPPMEPYTDDAWYDNDAAFGDDCYTTVPMVYGFPWGWRVCPIEPSNSLTVCLAHRFVWTKATGYPGAPKEGTMQGIRNAIEGYDAAVFGDNHKGFIRRIKGGPCVCNCGGFMRRKTDEADYRPGVGLLHADGTITRHYFDTDGERFTTFTDAEEAVTQHLDMTAFVEGLQTLGADDALDFENALNRFIRDNKIAEPVARAVLSAYEGGI